MTTRTTLIVRCRARTCLLWELGWHRPIWTRRRGPGYGSTSRMTAPLDWWTFAVMKLRARSRRRSVRALMTPGASSGRRTSGATVFLKARLISGELWRRLRLVRRARLSDVCSRGSRACGPSRAIPRSEGSARAATTPLRFLATPCPSSTRRFVFLGVVTRVNIKILWPVLVASTSTPSTRRLLDGVAMPVHHRWTECTRLTG
jgi:hypothetical protein